MPRCLQCVLVLNPDLLMYHRESDTPFQCHTTNLNEDLGQVRKGQSEVHGLGRGVGRKGTPNPNGRADQMTVPLPPETLFPLPGTESIALSSLRTVTVQPGVTPLFTCSTLVTTNAELSGESSHGETC